MDTEKDIKDFVKKSDMYEAYMKQKEFQPLGDMQRELMERSALYLEFLARAYLKETNIPASECVLVVSYGLDKIMFSYKRKTDVGVLGGE